MTREAEKPQLFSPVLAWLSASEHKLHRRLQQMSDSFNFEFFDGTKLRWLVYIFSIFSGAYLLFQIEPLIAKYILPWFGGSPAVWTTCMLFFQFMLLAGYSYAHLSLSKLLPGQQALLHIVLLGVAWLTLPITPSPAWQPTDGAQPVVAILKVLFGCVGLPFFMLATTSPLLQAWFVRICPGRSPYSLYALSNLGSLLALLSYPFLFEPYFRLGQQTLGWSLGFGVYVLLCSGLAYDFRYAALANNLTATPPSIAEKKRTSDHLSPVLLWFMWLALPAATSMLLLAITNQLCQDVASVPFLWILPLSVYLITFIFCFAEHLWYHRGVFIPASLLGTYGLVSLLYNTANFSLEWQIAIYCLGLFSCCMICHGELYRLRPQPVQLTAYYLAISIGGAIGGLFVAILSPLLFRQFFEFQIGIFACSALSLISVALDKQILQPKRQRRIVWMSIAGLMCWLAWVLINDAVQISADKMFVARNFYGVLRVENREMQNPQQAKRVLRHGAIDHGFQFLAPEKQQIPTTYYVPQSGIGLVLQHFPAPNKRVGLVGLGIGTLLTYGKAEDYFRLYDINPTVVELAQNYFSFLEHSKAHYDLVIADARIALEREPPQNFDILILDAFSGDAIPMHLLTTEAVTSYFKHLQTNGVLAIHMTNHYLDLSPLIKGLAAQMHSDYRLFRYTPATTDKDLFRSDWAIITRNQTLLKQPEIQAAHMELPADVKQVVWTDDFSNLFNLLKK